MIRTSMVVPGSDHQLVEGRITAAYDKQAAQLREGKEFGMAEEAYGMLMAQLRWTTDMSVGEARRVLAEQFGLRSPENLLTPNNWQQEKAFSKATTDAFVQFCQSRPSDDHKSFAVMMHTLPRFIQGLENEEMPSDVGIDTKPFRSWQRKTQAK